MKFGRVNLVAMRNARNICCSYCWILRFQILGAQWFSFFLFSNNENRSNELIDRVFQPAEFTLFHLDFYFLHDARAQRDQKDFIVNAVTRTRLRAVVTHFGLGSLKHKISSVKFGFFRFFLFFQDNLGKKRFLVVNRFFFLIFTI